MGHAYLHGARLALVVAMMAGLDEGAVHTCSIAFKDKAFDESEYAQQVAQFGIRYPMNARPVQSLHGRTVAASS